MDLSPRQAIIAAQGEILVRSFAKIGLIALVDEATGYQYEREKAELQAILKTYIAEEILEWQKTFQLDFYKEIFRLWDIPFTAENLRCKPRLIGKLTKELVLKEQTPKTSGGNYKYKFHQALTPE